MGTKEIQNIGHNSYCRAAHDWNKCVLTGEQKTQKYSIGGKAARKLYVIGNGFDMYHGAQSGYLNFRRYLYRRSPQTVAFFDLYFGPRSLWRSFTSPDGWLKCLYFTELSQSSDNKHYPTTTWSKSNLWADFESNLGELNREKIFDILDMLIPDNNESDDEFSYAEYLAPLDTITSLVDNCTYEMKYHFHRWINTLHYEKGFRKRMLTIDPDALFLNFNYTSFLESEYNIPKERICYIHGSRKEKFGSLILGHHSDTQEAFERWLHKNRNRRRYRHIQKDNNGNYFANDKLAYLAYFSDNIQNPNWRLSTRYHAARQAKDRFEIYYKNNFKNSKSIIEKNMEFFDALSNVEKVIVIGSSLGTVDIDYFLKLRQSLKEDVIWTISYHSESDLKRVENFYKTLNIQNIYCNTFKL